MKSWVKFGLIWGAFMYIMMVVLFPLWDKKDITPKSLLIGIPIWFIGGLIFGYVSRQRRPHDKGDNLN